MSDDLLEQLGRIEREARPDDAWDDVLDGRRPVDAVVQERRAAGDDPEELEALARASAPVGEAERQAWVGRLRAAMASPVEAGAGDAASPAPVEAEAGGVPPVDLAARRAQRRRWGVGGGVALAAAAAVLLTWGGGRPSGTEGSASAERLPLPSFSLVVRNETVSEVRSADASDAAGPDRYRPDSSVHWMVQPEGPVAGVLELAAIVRDDAGGACLARPAVARASETGVLEVRGTVEEVLGLTAGHWTVELVVARAGALPADAPGAECARPRDLPCPCPARVLPGVPLEPAPPEDPDGAAGRARVASYELEIDPS